MSDRPESRSTQRFYRPELDGLRFFAFFAVYLNHTLGFGTGGQFHTLPVALGNALNTVGLAGSFGVDLFFVLSAYLITELLLRERAARGFVNVPAFYVRRMLRIWPLYFSFLALAFLLAQVIPTEKFTWVHLVGFILFSGNWVYMLWPVATVAAPLWSVSIEEQFYLVWPWVVRRASERRIAGFGIAVLVLGALVCFGLARHHLYGDYVAKNSLTRIDGIAAGILLAIALGGRLPRLGERTRWVVLACGTATWLWVVRDFDLLQPSVPVWAQVTGWPLVALASCAVLVAVLGGKGALTGLLQRQPFVYLGKVSYGLYVFHQLGLLIAARVFPRFLSSAAQWLGHWFLGLSVTLVLAAASHRWLESWFLRLKTRRFTVVQSGAEPA